MISSPADFAASLDGWTYSALAYEDKQQKCLGRDELGTELRANDNHTIQYAAEKRNVFLGI
jgi:hypothetical protein